MNSRLRMLPFVMVPTFVIAAAVLPALGESGETSGQATANAAPLDLIAPPPPDKDSLPPAPTGPTVLSPVRANVSLTTNALLGFVNSEPVFVEDLFRPIDGQLRNLAKNSRSLAEFRQGARSLIHAQMQTLISDTLVLSAAKASLSEDEKRGLDMYIATERSKLISKHGGSVALADEALKSSGTSVAKEMDRERKEMIVRMYIHREIAPRIVVTRQMVMDEYERTPHTQDAELELYLLTLRVTRWLHEPGQDGKIGPLIKNPTPAQIHRAEQTAMATARDIIAQLHQGADFARLVEDYSDDKYVSSGGRLGNVKRGTLNPEIEKEAFALPANTIGDPLLIKNPDFRREAVVVIKVGQKKEARTIPFSEAQKAIYDRLQSEQYSQLSAEYMKKLMKGAAVEAVERMTDVALDAAVARYATQ